MYFFDDENYKVDLTFMHHKYGQPIFMASIGSTPFERGDEAEGFLIVTAAADKGLVDVYDRRLLVLVSVAAGSG